MIDLNEASLIPPPPRCSASSNPGLPPSPPLCSVPFVTPAETSRSRQQCPDQREFCSHPASQGLVDEPVSPFLSLSRAGHGKCCLEISSSHVSDVSSPAQHSSRNSKALESEASALASDIALVNGNETVPENPAIFLSLGNNASQCVPSALKSEENETKQLLLVRVRKAPEPEPAICLSLGNNASQCESSASKLEENETKQLLLMPMIKIQKPDLFGLALGRSSIEVDTISFLSKQSIAGQPFWNGKICVKDGHVVRAEAYSLGLLKPESRLRKFPHMMSVRKFVTSKELSERFITGVTEPVIRFIPSIDISGENVDDSQFTVETLLGSDIAHKEDCQLDLELGHANSLFRTSLASYAAVISLDALGDSPEAELFLIKPACFQEILQTWLPNVSICALEEVDVCDCSTLYGVLLFSELSHGSLVNKQLANNEFDSTEQSASWLMVNGIKCLGGKFVSELEKEQNEMKGTSCSLSISHDEEVKVAAESSLVREPSRLRPASSPFYLDDSQTDTDNDGTDFQLRESRNQYDGYKFSLKRKPEPDKGMIVAGEGSHTENIPDEEDNRDVQSKDRDQDYWSWKNIKDNPRFVQSQGQHDEQIKKSIPYWSKEEKRVSGCDSGIDHGRSWKSGDSRDLDDDNYWDQGRKRVKENLRKEQENAIEADSSIFETKKVAVNMEHSTSISENGFLNGNHVGKEWKKRQREEDDDSNISKRSSKETKSCFENMPDIVVKDGKQVMDLKPDSTEDLFTRRTDEISSREMALKEFMKEAACRCKVDSLFPAKEKDGAENIELDNRTTSHFIANGNNLQNKAFGDDSEKDIGSLHIELPSESIGITNVGRETFHTNMHKAVESSDLAVLKTDASGFLPLAKVEGNEALCDLLLVEVDRETRSWLTSKQSMLYFQEEYGVLLVIIGERHNLDCCSKSDHQQGALHVRITMLISDSCDTIEATWFVNQAADMVRVIASHGIFSKCIWYAGPVQVETGDSVPSISALVKKIKGEDRKNLERIQESTGVMIGVVLRKGATAVHASKMNTRFVGLRLKCIRRKGLLEALKQAEALLSHVTNYFLNEIAANAANSQDTCLILSGNYSIENSSPSQAPGTTVNDLLSASPTKVEDSSGQPHLSTGDDASAINILAPESASFDKHTNIGLSIMLEGASPKSLCITNLPENVTSPNIKDLFESILNQKLGLSQGANLVVAVRCIPEKHSALIEFANDTILNEALKIYADDETTFHGFKVELGIPVASKLSRKSLSVHAEVGSRVCNSDGNPEDSKYMKVTSTRNAEDHSRQQPAATTSSEGGSEYLNERCADEHGTCLRKGHLFEKPKPLFLTELMRNASGQAIKQLFEEVIKKYISPSLISSGGRQLVLDVRHVPSRGCAFVDLATPELVKFMLELHSQRPDVFCNMKMELGRRPVPHFLDDDADRRLPRSHDDTSRRSQGRGYVSGGNYTHRDITFGSQRQTEKRLDVSFRDYDYFDESDRGEDYLRQPGFSRRHRSDPEKTVYADRLPVCASEMTIKRIFECVLSRNLTKEQCDIYGNDLVTEVRYISTKFCAFIVFCAEELTHLALQLYNKDENVFDKMRLKPHFHSRMEDMYREEFQERDNNTNLCLSREKILDCRGSHHGSDDHLKAENVELYDGRSCLTAHQIFSASAFKEVDRRRSVYVDRIPEDISEATMRDLFEKVFRRNMHEYDLHMVSQVTFFRDKYYPKKLCAFLEVRNEDATRDLIECYQANEGAFLGMRVRPAIKYNN